MHERVPVQVPEEGVKMRFRMIRMRNARMNGCAE